VRKVLAPDLRCTAISFAPDEPILVAASEDGALLRYRINVRQLPSVLDRDVPVYSLSHSPEGRFLAAGRANGEVVLWDTGKAGPRPMPRGHNWTVYALAFTPDGRTLVSGGADGTVRLWDVEARRERQCFRWHARWVTCAGVAPDGMTAAAGSADHSVVVWDLDAD
jgi:WD40 repeat protein